MKRTISNEKKPKVRTDDLESPQTIRGRRDERMKKEITIYQKGQKGGFEGKYMLFLSIREKESEDRTIITETYETIWKLRELMYTGSVGIRVIGVNEEEDTVTLEIWRMVHSVIWNSDGTDTVKLEHVGPLSVKEIKLHVLTELEKSTYTPLFVYLIKREEFERVNNAPIRWFEEPKILKESRKWSNLIYLTPDHTHDEERDVMMKRMRKDVPIQVFEQYLRETEVYEKIREVGEHPCICRLVDKRLVGDSVQEGSIFPTLVLEQGTDLRQYMLRLYSSSPIIYYSNMKNFGRDMVEGVRYLHQLGYIHFDIKTENFIFKRENGIGRVKLMDFGFALKESEVDSEKYGRGTNGFRAKEMMYSVRKPYPYRVDVWSLGCTFLNILGKDLKNFALVDKVDGIIGGEGHLEKEERRRCKRYEQQELLYDLIEKAFSDYEQKMNEFDGTGKRRSRIWKDIIKRMLVIQPRDREDLENIRIPDGV